MTEEIELWRKREVWHWDDLDKAAWGDGPWLTEPDKVSWIDEATDLPCLIVRGPVGSLCGYVGVEPGHPLHGMNYDECLTCEEKFCWKEGHDNVDRLLDAHGGVTFAGPCHSGEEARGICHVPAPGHSGDVWWFGFDTSHYMDYSPSLVHKLRTLYGFPYETYRDVGYVHAQCQHLAEQLKGM